MDLSGACIYGLDRPPLPSAIAGDFENRIIVVERAVGLSEANVCNRVLGENSENLLELSGTKTSAYPVQESEARGSEEQACYREDLLLGERKNIRPVLLGIQPPAAGQDRLDAQCAQCAEDPAV